MQHRITVAGAGPYSVAGAVAIASTKRPIQEAAAALRTAGAPDSDVLRVACQIISVSSLSIGSILKPRTFPKAMYAGAHTSSY